MVAAAAVIAVFPWRGPTLLLFAQLVWSQGGGGEAEEKHMA